MLTFLQFVIAESDGRLWLKLEAAVATTSRHLEESSKAVEDVPTTLSDVRLVFADSEVAH